MTAGRPVLTVEELSALTTVPAQTIRDRLRRHGTFLGVRPIPDTGRHKLFSAAQIERALAGERAS